MRVIPILGFRRLPKEISIDVALGSRTSRALGPLPLLTSCSSRLVSDTSISSKAYWLTSTVIQGGSQLSSTQIPAHTHSPHNSTTGSTDAVSSSLPEGLQAIRRNLSINEMPTPEGAGPGAMLQLPQYYWNHLSAGAASLGNNIPFFNEPNQQIPWSNQMNTIPLPQVNVPTPGPSIWVNPGMNNLPLSTGLDMAAPPMLSGDVQSGAAGSGGGGGGTGMESIFPESFDDQIDWNMFDFGATSSAPTAAPSDPAAISAALMSFMANAAKGR